MRVSPLCEDDAQPADQVLPLHDAQTALGLGMHQPAFQPGWSIQETGQDAQLEGMDSPPAASRLGNSASMRGAVLAPATHPAVSHPSTDVAEDMLGLPAWVVLPKGTFSLRGELMHAFVSYRVATEGMVLTLHQRSTETRYRDTSTLLHFRPLHIAHP
jgi:hypothetical protein